MNQEKQKVKLQNMLNNCFIKCQNTGKRERKYAALKKDPFKYIDGLRRYPERYDAGGEEPCRPKAAG